MDQKNIEPFHVEIINLKLTFSKAGNYRLIPIFSYMNASNVTKTSKLKTIIIAAEPAFSKDKSKSSTESSMPKLHQFKSEATEKAYSFLISAFQEDYCKKRLPQEKCGWRTMMEITKNAQITKHSMYGQSGRGGQVPSELGHLGLVESRFFTGERGRGGRVLKIRICP